MDVLDAFHRRGQEAFEQIRDAPFYLLRQQAAVDPDHGGDGNSDIREDVGRHVEHRLGAQQHDQDGHDDEGVRPSQGNENDLVHARRLPKAVLGLQTTKTPPTNRHSGMLTPNRQLGISAASNPPIT